MDEDKLEFNIDEAKTFLEKLDKNASSFTFQTFDDSKENRAQLTKVMHGSLSECASELKRLNQAGAGIFVTVNETDGKGRSAENIVRVRSLFVDLDGAPIQPVKDWQNPANMIINTSPDRWHAYWFVDGLELDEFRAAQGALIERFDADPAVTDLPRVMRLPGFLHRKDDPYPVSIKSSAPIVPYPGKQFRVEKRPAVTTSASSEAPDNEQALAVLDAQCTTVSETPDGSKSRNHTLNKAAYTLGGLVGAGLLNEDTVRERLLLAADECGLTRKEASRTIQSGLTTGMKAPWSPSMMLDPQDPMRSARKLIEIRFTSPHGERLLHRHRESFWSWNGSCYEMLTKEDVKAVVYNFTQHARTMGKDGPTSFKPNKNIVDNIYEALAAQAHLNDAIDPPTWLTTDSELPAPREFISVKNGLLHLPTRRLWSPTPSFFNTAASRIPYEPHAPIPERWLTFLDDIFGDDHETREAMQEFFGYALSTDTSQQKIMLMVGPPRSGKGTSGRILRELLGPESVAGPTMHSLSGEFGMEVLIPRSLAIISDARMGARTDKAAVTERLLSISGEDPLSINRKQKSFWNGRLQTRFVILTNELPSLSDSSGAMANRFIIVLVNNSFLGKEDHGLYEALLAELPGILNWAIDGYERLRKRGHFVQPSNSTEALEEMLHLASPVRAFVSECCEVGPTCEDEVDLLFDRYRTWCDANGLRARSKEWFGKDLREVLPGLRKKEDRRTRDRIYVGVQRVLDDGPKSDIPSEEMPF